MQNLSSHLNPTGQLPERQLLNEPKNREGSGGITIAPWPNPDDSECPAIGPSHFSATNFAENTVRKQTNGANLVLRHLRVLINRNTLSGFNILKNRGLSTRPQYFNSVN